jgi:hypothetical protein
MPSGNIEKAKEVPGKRGTHPMKFQVSEYATNQALALHRVR